MEGSRTPRQQASLLDPPVGFAHRGARVLERENTLPAFILALRLGATGLEADVWLTADGVPVIDHDGRVGALPRRRPISEVAHHELPSHIPTVAELFAAVDPQLPVTIDVKDHDAAPAVAGAATARGRGASQLYLCAEDLETLGRWADLGLPARLVHSTRLRGMKRGAERHVAALAGQGGHVLNMPYADWNAGLVALCHRFGILAFAWDAHHRRQLDELLSMGCDAVIGDHPDRLADALAALDPL